MRCISCVITSFTLHHCSTPQWITQTQIYLPVKGDQRWRRKSAGRVSKDLGEMEGVLQKLTNEDNPREVMNEEQAEVEDAITEITRADIEMALRNMKNGKATGPDNLPVEV